MATRIRRRYSASQTLYVFSCGRAKEANNIWAIPLRNVHEIIYTSASRLNIPQDAIFINVGCEDPEPLSLYPQVSSDEPFLHPIEVLWDAPPQVSYGEPIALKLSLKNVIDETVSFILGGSIPHDFVATSLNGQGVWYWSCAKAGNFHIPHETPEPGDKVENSGEWQQVNSRGEPVSPGDYLVHGTLIIGSFAPPRSNLYQLGTEPLRPEILKP